MPPRVTAPKHYRNGGPVAMCGARDGDGELLTFSGARSGITCEECRTRLDAAIARKVALRARGALRGFQ